MTEENIDRALTEWARDYVAGKSLPKEFSARLCLSVRRSRRMFRLKVSAIATLSVVAAMFAVGIAGRTTQSAERKTALVEATDGTKRECVTSWALLSMFRECFRRGRTGKRKEEE